MDLSLIFSMILGDFSKNVEGEIAVISVPESKSLHFSYPSYIA